MPTNVFFFVMVAVSCPETPKSASLTWPFDPSRTFAAVSGGVFISNVDARSPQGKNWHTLDVSVQLVITVQVLQPHQ